MAVRDGKRTCSTCKELLPAMKEYFYTNTGKNSDGWQANCKPCCKIKAVAWQKANPEKKRAADAKENQKPERKAAHNARAKAAYARDPSKTLARGKAWQEANPERALARQRAWVAANPEKAKAQQDRHNAKPARIQYLRFAAKYRRALYRSAGVFISYDLWQRALDVHGRVCVYCDGEGEMSMDHIDPISKGGAHVMSNLIPACLTCNKVKRARTVEVFAPERAAAIRAKATHVATLLENT